MYLQEVADNTESPPPRRRAFSDYTKISNEVEARTLLPSLDLKTTSLDISTPLKMKKECEKFVIIFDLETTGLPEKGPIFGYPNPRKLIAYSKCRVVQICAMLCRKEDLSQIEFKNIIIKSDGFDITNGTFHGITPERSQSEGVPFKDVFQKELGEFFKRAKFIIAHNSEFDVNVLKSELYRYELTDVLEHVDQMDTICSMRKTKALVGALSSPNNIKNPSLAELYKFSTGKEISNQHDAKFDVIHLHEAIVSLLKEKKFTI